MSDEAKHALCTGRKATECVTWLQEFNERQKTRLEVAEGGTAITEAELASLTPAERKARQRQQILDERVVHSLSAAQNDVNQAGDQSGRGIPWLRSWEAL